MDPTFEIYLDTELSREELIELLLSQLAESTRRGGYVRADGNLVTFERNFDHDPARVDSSCEPWQFYRYHCDVFPRGATDADKQQLFARKLLEIFARAGVRAELFSEFSS